MRPIWLTFDWTDGQRSMPLIEINRDPTDRQLRQFGVVCLFVLPLLGWWWGAERTTLGWIAVVSGAIAVTALTRPKFVKPLFVGLSLLTAPIGIVMGEVALLLIFLTVFLPIGLFFRLTRRDALQLKLNRETKSYWQTKPPARDPASYFRQS